MIVSLIIAISMFSWYGITDKITEIQHDKKEESKLNQILAAADEPKNITVYVIPNTSLGSSSSPLIVK